jgi:hypothetical protein
MQAAAYIYTSEVNGEIDASRLKFTFERGKTVSPGIIQKLKGKISLLSGQEVGVCDKRWVFTA